MSHFWPIFFPITGIYHSPFCILGWDSLFSARQDFRKNSFFSGEKSLGLLLRAGVSQMLLFLLDGSGRRGFFAQRWPLQPQMSLQKCWFDVTLISTKSAPEASASSTAHQCNNAIPKTPTSGTILTAFHNKRANRLLKTINTHRARSNPTPTDCLAPS